MKTVLVAILIVALAVAGGAYYVRYMAADPLVIFRTAAVERGDLFPTISATGTVEPEEVVDVGAQVAGLIQSLGRDPKDPSKQIDYGSTVQENTVLARIDESVYQSQVNQAKATLARSQADLLRLGAVLAQTANDLRRAKDLIAKKAIADTDYDAAVANYKVAEANVHVGEAAIEQDKAQLKLAEINLGYTTIKSPVQGVIVDRRVNIGQTVVAALNAPSLFLIAKDLRRMQVWASVNEADIGRIHEGLPVRFTVDAYPTETFRGKVAQIRLNATMTQNVVTYTVVIETDNSNLKLLPYLTANVQFEIEHRRGVLQVPNAALRWKPRTQLIAADDRAAAMAVLSGKGVGKQPPAAAEGGRASSSAGDREKSPPDAKHPPGVKTAHATAKDVAAAKAVAQSPKLPREHTERGFLWIRDPNDETHVRMIKARVGPTDGMMTEISGSEVKEGMEVVIGEVVAQADSDTTNPFAPKLFKGGAPKGKQ